MPPYPGFCGPSNAVQSPLVDAQRLVNWYVEKSDSPFSPAGSALYPTPGATPFAGAAQGITDVNSRAAFEENGRCFFVIGGGLYELFQTGAVINRGAVAQDGNPATICSNGLGGQLLITSGSNAYCLVLASNAFSQVLTGEATMGGMKDGFFLAFNIANGKVRLSALNDGTTWPALQFFQRSIAPDPWQAMVVANPQIWMIGEHTSEAWYNSGASPQPFAPILSSFMQQGTAAPFSAALAGDVVTWVNNTVSGKGIIVGARGYVPTPLSNYAVETALSGYARTASIDDCEQLVYQQEGHQFAVFNFPSANATWAADVDTGAWHERGSWNSPQNRFDVWRPRVHCEAFGKHLVGDRATGTISVLDVTSGTEADGTVIRRVRVAPPLLASSRQRLQVSRLQLVMDTGLGLTAGQGSNPLVMARFSQDARTFGALRNASAGAMGQYARRVYWTRCSSSQKVWMPEISVTDPIPWRIAGAEVDGSGIGALPRSDYASKVA